MSNVRKGCGLSKSCEEEAVGTLNIISHSSAQTQRLGMRLGELLQGGELLLLDGKLGTGKTTFTQGVARGLGIEEVISSPTFTLLKEYEAQPLGGEQSGFSGRRMTPALYHFDLYRLDDAEEMLELGFEDYFSSLGVCVVEWADKADRLWPTEHPEHLRIQMKMMSETKRGLLFSAMGVSYCRLLRQFQKNAYATLSS